MQRNSASYRSITDSIISNIIWSIIHIFLYTQVHPSCAGECHPDPVPLEGPCSEGRGPLLSLVRGPFLSTPWVPGHVAVPEPVTQSQSKTEHFSRPGIEVTLCSAKPWVGHVTWYPLVPYSMLREAVMLYPPYWSPELNVDPCDWSPKAQPRPCHHQHHAGSSLWGPLSTSELWKEIGFSLACVVHSLSDGDLPPTVTSEREKSPGRRVETSPGTPSVGLPGCESGRRGPA